VVTPPNLLLFFGGVTEEVVTSAARKRLRLSDNDGGDDSSDLQHEDTEEEEEEEMEKVPQRNCRRTKLTPLRTSLWPRMAAGSSWMTMATPSRYRQSHTPLKPCPAVCARTLMAVTTTIAMTMTFGCR
jgi:hypothetical protein